MRDLLRRWWDVTRHPRVTTFDRQWTAASWSAVWLGLALVAVVEALGVAHVIYGPNAGAGYSSLPIGPKVHLPQTPLLPLAALGGSIGQFFVFSGLLYLSAHLVGGRGGFKTQSHLLALFWVPLMAVSDLAVLIPGVGALLGVLVRVYALALCGLALASAHGLSLRRAWTALLLPIASGLLLGLVVVLTIGPQVLAAAGIH